MGVGRRRHGRDCVPGERFTADGHPVEDRSEFSRRDVTVVRAMAVVIVALVLPGCSSDEEPTSSPTSEAATGHPDASPQRPGFVGVAIFDNGFNEADLNLSLGDFPGGAEVNWLLLGEGTHSVTSDTGLFDSSPECPPDCLKREGDEQLVFRRTFDQPGTYRYYCKVHGGPGGKGMSG